MTELVTKSQTSETYDLALGVWLFVHEHNDRLHLVFHKRQITGKRRAPSLANLFAAANVLVVGNCARRDIIRSKSRIEGCQGQDKAAASRTAAQMRRTEQN